MMKQGRLTKEKAGFSMPLDAPLYCRPPIYYRNVESIAFTYETDEEAALDMLPQGLQLTSPPTATVLFIRYPFSTLGPYEEAILGITCTRRGQPRFYIAHIVLNSDAPLAAGREIWGYPKKLAVVTLQKEGDIIWGRMERPRGNLICTGAVRPEIPVDLQTLPAVPGLSLRVIPSPEESAPPSLMELIEVPPNSTTHEAWEGLGFLQFHSNSTIDPWHKLCAKKLISARYRRYDQILEYGKIVKRY